MCQNEELVLLQWTKWPILLHEHDISIYEALESVEFMGLSPKITKAAAEFQRFNHMTIHKCKNICLLQNW